MWAQALYTESSTQKARLGAKRRLNDGREFVYVQQAANIGSGLICQAANADVANQGNLAVTANANVGERLLAVTLGATSAANTLNEFAEGWLHENTVNGSNWTAYKIKQHAAIAANANGTFQLYDKIRANLTTSSKITVTLNKHKKVIAAPTGLVGTIVGVTVMPMTANYYGWIQTKGECAVAVNGSCNQGDGVVPEGGVAGYGGPSTVNDLTPAIGYCMVNNADNGAALVDLNI
jgi:hypothetical protein